MTVVGDSPLCYGELDGQPLKVKLACMYSLETISEGFSCKRNIFKVLKLIVSHKL